MRPGGRAEPWPAGAGHGGKLIDRLHYQLRWERYQALLATFTDDERPVEPEVPIWGEQSWRAWSELCSERPYYSVGHVIPMGATIIKLRPGPIPWSAIQAWCDRARCTIDDREFTVPLILAIDRAYLAWMAAQDSASGERVQTPEDKLARWDRED